MLGACLIRPLARVVRPGDIGGRLMPGSWSRITAGFAIYAHMVVPGRWTTWLRPPSGPTWPGKSPIAARHMVHPGIRARCARPNAASRSTAIKSAARCLSSEPGGSSPSVLRLLPRRNGLYRRIRARDATGSCCQGPAGLGCRWPIPVSEDPDYDFDKFFNAGFCVGPDFRTGESDNSPAVFLE